MSKLIVLRSFVNPSDAQFAKALLDDAEIPCVLHDVNTSAITNLSTAVGGVKLMIPEEFAAESIEILKSEFQFDQTNEGIFGLLEENEKCPNCGSNRVFSESRQSILSIIFTILVSISFLQPRKVNKHLCRDCRRTWRSY